MAHTQIDPATVVQFTKTHCEEVGSDFPFNDVDRIVLLAKEFDKRFGKIDWEESEQDWESAICNFYKFQFNNPNFK